MVLEVKAFERWATHVLEPRGIVINDLSKDFCNGLNLIYLVEALTGKIPARFNANPRLPMHKGENINHAIDILKNEKNVKLFQPDSNKIVEGNVNEILSLFTATYDGLYAGIKKVDLVNWVKKTISDISEISFTNKLSNWSDGNILCALLSKVVPSAPSYSSIDKSNAVNIAFETMSNNGIFCILTPEEFQQGDERSIQMQIVEIYKYANGTSSGAGTQPMKPIARPQVHTTQQTTPPTQPIHSNNLRTNQTIITNPQKPHVEEIKKEEPPKPKPEPKPEPKPFRDPCTDVMFVEEIEYDGDF